MDIKDLNKPQLIMLALLLSFVTSIATGITTVTLMQQAPSSVTVPINRIVRQTVEKIEQVEGKTTINTVVVKEEDLVVDAIAKNKSSVFSITKPGLDLEGKSIEISAGQSFVVNNDGLLVADAALVGNKENFVVQNGSGKFKAEFVSKDEKGFSFLKIGAPVDPKDKLTFTLPTFGDLNKMKAGQKVLVIGPSLGSFIFDGNKDIKIAANKSNAGGMVVNLDGEVLGIVLSSETNTFAPIDAIKESLKALAVPKP